MIHSPLFYTILAVDTVLIGVLVYIYMVLP
jgi:hypothetical protein